ncbi:MAG: hypothetical protein C5B50_04140 [Verrucomicrobia bacterium]|nr:MAG: hypothetical protein C5B50_04140 [Verrucomicrobiota bacterium]
MKTPNTKHQTPEKQQAPSTKPVAFDVGSPLINTVALARCKAEFGSGKLFQQFAGLSDKPLKRLLHSAPILHRAKATVLMRGLAPNCRAHLTRLSLLRFGVWSFSGVWCLVFGVSVITSLC